MTTSESLWFHKLSRWQTDDENFPGNDKSKKNCGKTHIRRYVQQDLLCTKNVHFTFNKDIYKQTDGVAMGSPLDPVVADYHLEDELHYLEKIFAERNNYPRWLVKQMMKKVLDEQTKKKCSYCHY